MPKRTIVTFGTYDLFHIGHLRILERAAALGDTLIVGVSSDELTFVKKQAWPTMPFEDRTRIVAALRCVDQVFEERSLELKRDYLIRYGAAVLVMGDDWRGQLDAFSDICSVVYLERTPDISSTEIKERLRAADELSGIGTSGA